jgi:hypothetical protein
MARGTRFVAFKIPQGGHSVIAAVTSASLLLVGAAVSTLVLETPLTQALAATARAEAAAPAAAATPQGACDRWRKSTASVADAPCAVDELVVSQDLVVARLNLHSGRAVEVMHLIDGHVDEDWHLASTHAWR